MIYYELDVWGRKGLWVFQHIDDKFKDQFLDRTSTIVLSYKFQFFFQTADGAPADQGSATPGSKHLSDSIDYEVYANTLHQ